MGESALYKIPWPEVTDIPHGPLQMEEIAETVDAIKWLSRSVKLTAGVKKQGENKKLEPSYVDMPSLELSITPDVASNLIVIAHAEGTPVSSNTGIIQTAITVDGSAQTVQPTASLVTGAASAHTGAAYVIPLTAAAHTIKMRAKDLAGGSAKIESTSMTHFLYLLLAS